MKKTLSRMVLLVFSLLVLSACGGGGGGGAALQPATYNVNGNWGPTETTIAGGTCPGAIPGQVDNFTVAVVHTGVENNLTFRDTRSVTSEPATISGSVVIYSGPRYDPFASGCDSLTESFSVTLSSATHFSGTGTITCNYVGGSCTVLSTLVGNKI